MRTRYSVVLLVVGVAAACTRGWPAPPPVDESAYRREYAAFIKEQQETAADALSLVGVWQLDEGDTPFGSAPDQPIVLPVAGVAPHAGMLRRSGGAVTVIPARGVRLVREDGTSVTSAAPIDQGPPLLLGPIHLESYSVPPAVFVDGRDPQAPALRDFRVEAFPIDPRWRVAARFDAFEHPKPIKISTTRGTVVDQTAVGQLVFRLNDREYRLTALGEPGRDEFFVMFKDETNGRSTFSGYRMLAPKTAGNGKWTELDFNFAGNPPCAYSKFTMCPLPPQENRLPVALEAGIKRDPNGRGYSE